MYYLTFTLPKVKTLLEQQGFAVEVCKDLFESPSLQDYRLIIATKR